MSLLSFTRVIPNNTGTSLFESIGIVSISTIEKVKSVVDKDKERAMKKRLEEGKFTMDDMLEQVENIGQVGAFGKIAELITGMGKLKGKMPEDMLGKQEERMKKWKHIILSMTPAEKENPELLEKQTSRIQRIAKGSGTNTSDVRALLKQYKILKDFVKTGEEIDLSKGMMNQKQLQKLAKKFGKKIKLR